MKKFVTIIIGSFLFGSMGCNTSLPVADEEDWWTLRNRDIVQKWLADFDDKAEVIAWGDINRVWIIQGTIDMRGCGMMKGSAEWDMEVERQRKDLPHIEAFLGDVTFRSRGKTISMVFTTHNRGMNGKHFVGQGMFSTIEEAKTAIRHQITHGMVKVIE